MTLGAALVLGVLEMALRVTSAVYWRDEGRPGADPGCLLPQRVLDCSSCPKILVVGDSYTYGVGAWKGHDYPSQLQILLNTPPREPPVLVVNGGVGAANSTFVLERLKTYLKEFTPDLVLILAGGTNAINFSRYYAFAKPSGLPALLDTIAYHVRTIRLFRYAVADMTFMPVPQGGDPYQDVDPGTLVDLYINWIRAHPLPGHHLDAVQMEGLAHLRKGDWAGARTVWVDALRTTQNDTGYLWGLAFALRQQGEYAEAFRVHQDALRSVPRDPMHLQGAGICQMYQGLADPTAPAWFEHAERFFRRGIDAVPSWSGNYCGLGTVLEIRREREEAVAVLERGVDVNPEDPMCYPSLLAIAELLGKHDKVAAYLDQYSDRSEAARNTALLLRRERKAATAWMRHDLNAMIDLCQSRGIPVMLQDYPHDTGANAVLRSVAHDRHVPIVRHRDVFQAMLDAGTPVSDLFIPDMHCNDRGYEVMAQDIYRTLQKMNWPRQGADMPQEQGEERGSRGGEGATDRPPAASIR